MFDVSKSGFYSWRTRPLSRQAKKRHDIWQLIVKILQSFNHGIGYRQVAKQVRKAHYAVSNGRVQRLLQRHGYRAIAARKVRRFKSAQVHKFIPNLLNRQFNVTKANQVWVSDITQIPSKEGWLYLCTINDLGSRAIVGHSMGRRPDALLVRRALEAAMRCAGKDNLNDLLFHSDQGAQYTCYQTQKWLTDQGATLSLSRRGNCWDNACAESFFSLLKQQWLKAVSPQTAMQKLKGLIAHYIDKIYNRSRIHGYHNRIPMEYYVEMK